MPNPSNKRVHYNAMLSNISVAYMANQDFIHSAVFPEVFVNNKSDNYWVYDPESLNRDEMKPLAPATESAGIGSRLSTDTYNCLNYALHEDISDEELDNADDTFDLKADATELLSHKALINKENAWHDKYFKTGVWNTDVDVTASADFGSVSITDASSKFIEGIKIACQNQKLASHGFKPNTLILSQDVWRVLSDHVQFLDRISGGATSAQPAKVLRAHLATILEIDNVLVSEAILNNAAEGQAASNEFFASNKALLCYVAPKMGRKTPSAGATFVWKRKSKGVVKGVSIRDFYMEKTQATRVEIEQNYDFKLVSPLMGTFFSNII